MTLSVNMPINLEIAAILYTTKLYNNEPLCVAEFLDDSVEMTVLGKSNDPLSKPPTFYGKDAVVAEAMKVAKQIQSVQELGVQFALYQIPKITQLAILFKEKIITEKYVWAQWELKNLEFWEWKEVEEHERTVRILFTKGTSYIDDINSKFLAYLDDCQWSPLQILQKKEKPRKTSNRNFFCILL